MGAYIAYVDRELANQVATGLIGSQVALTKQRGATSGVNFKVIFSATTSTQHSSTTSIENLLPEVLMDAIQEVVPDKVQSLDDARGRLLSGAADGFRPGDPLLLRNASLQALSDGSKVRQNLAGEACAATELASGSFSMHAFVREAHEPAIHTLFGEPLEILGVLRYTQPYRTKGAAALNLGFRVVAIWLR